MIIKFKAKTIATKNQPSKWVYGYYHTAPLTIENFGIGYLATPDGKKIHCISTEHGVTWQIDEKTIGQYIGIEDKNEKEIYTGDLIKLIEWKENPDIYRIHPNKFEVCYSENFAKFEMYSPDELWGELPDGSERQTDEGIEMFMEFKDVGEQIFEIIGNIHE